MPELTLPAAAPFARAPHQIELGEKKQKQRVIKVDGPASGPRRRVICRVLEQAALSHLSRASTRDGNQLLKLHVAVTLHERSFYYGSEVRVGRHKNRTSSDAPALSNAVS